MHTIKACIYVLCSFNERIHNKFLKDYLAIGRGCFPGVDFQQNLKEGKKIPAYLFWQGI